MSITIKHFNNAQTRGQTLAQSISADLQTTLQHQDHVTLAVSGGSTPKTFFQALSQQPLDWTRITIMLVDERVVKDNHSASNTALVKANLIQNQAQQAHLHTYLDQTALDNPSALQQYASQQFIQPDIVVLGMGEDGHTASIFPHSPSFNQLISADADIQCAEPSNAPHLRLTLTLRAILNASKIYIEIGGQQKKQIIKQAMQGNNPDLPISYILAQPQPPIHLYQSD